LILAIQLVEILKMLLTMLAIAAPVTLKLGVFDEH
jgi:hypothetical protein